MYLLSHLTPFELPLGVVLFVVGFVAGSAVVLSALGITNILRRQ